MGSVFNMDAASHQVGSLDSANGRYRELAGLQTLFFFRSKSCSGALRAHAWLTWPLLATCLHLLNVASSPVLRPCPDGFIGDYPPLDTTDIEDAIWAWLALQCGICVDLIGAHGRAQKGFAVIAIGASIALIARTFMGAGGMLLDVRGVRGAAEAGWWYALVLLVGWCCNLVYHLHAFASRGAWRDSTAR